MRFRMGLIIGFGAGYYLGSAAGRERHEQLRQAIERVKRSDAFETASEKAKAAAELTVERTKEFVEEHRHGDGNGHDPADLVTQNEPQAGR